jgi:hypothetical protein
MQEAALWAPILHQNGTSPSSIQTTSITIEEI